MNLIDYTLLLIERIRLSVLTLIRDWTGYETYVPQLTDIFIQFFNSLA